MKLLGVVLLITCVIISEQQKFEDVRNGWVVVFDKYKNECVAESKAEQTLAERMVTHGEFPENKELKCYTKCILANYKGINGAGELDGNVIGKFLGLSDETKRNKLLSKCGNVKHENSCDTAFHACKCLYSSTEELLKE